MHPILHGFILADLPITIILPLVVTSTAVPIHGLLQLFRPNEGPFNIGAAYFRVTSGAA